MYKKIITLLFCFLTLFSIVHAQLDSSLLTHLLWRSIGPYRGGRTVAAAGVVQQPNTFYIGVNNGGVWRTTDYGRTWQPIFDAQSSGSIGDVEVAPSNPDIIYVGSGEGLQRPDLSVGNGLYKSTDAGKTWMHLGLNEGQQIPKIAIDPTNADRLFVAVLGHPYGPNEERGIYRSTDGGHTFEKVLYTNENVGGDDVVIDPSNPNIVYATMWEARQGPWENGAWSGTGGGVYKSADGGKTWKKIMKGLPENLVQAHLAIAPSSPKTVYVVFTTTQPNEYGTGIGMGLYRSNDGGDSWQDISGDKRPTAKIGGGDLPVIKVDPQSAETIYSASVVLWRSADGGKTWTGIKGAPGGDDYQNLWINPLHPEVFLVTSDQGAAVSVNGGQTYSSWYNQPTAQLYHVSADNAFPYNLYSGQQESGSVGIASRGGDGEITFRDWHPVGVEEYGYVAPDPLDPNIIYGGKFTRYDKRTGQTKNIAPEAVQSGKYRFVRTEPAVFSPVDPHTLFFAGNVLFKTKNGGNSWQVISPDLSRQTWDVPGSVGIYGSSPSVKTMQRRGVIYTVAPSYQDVNTIWCGTDDGLIHRTKDGGKIWTNITPQEVSSWSKISLIDAGHFDVNTAYVAVNKIRLDDMHPYIFKTHDGGKTWSKIVTGLPNDPINAVREDPKRKGLLFAGSERAVYVSFDDGEHWQTLRLNMPATSIRDLMVKDDDLVAATHGRGFWILDNISSLRQMSSQLPQPTLFTPQTAYRVRWNTNTDTPLPPEEPAGQNPPDGAIIDYYLPTTASNATLQIFDSRGTLVRSYSASDTMYKSDVYIPPYWIRPQQILSKESGMHRFVWDLHYTPLNIPPSYPIAAVYGNTTPETTSPWGMPGSYTVKLTVDGRVFSKPLLVKIDPRVKTGISGLQSQHDLSLQVYSVRKQLLPLLREIETARTTAKTGKGKDEIENFTKASSGRRTPASLDEQLKTLFDILQDSDTAPTQQEISAVQAITSDFQQLKTRWKEIKKLF